MERAKRKVKPPAILQKFLLESGPDELGEWGAFCPIHLDNDPSASFNFSKGVWICHAGCGAGKIKELIDHLDLEQSVEEDATTGSIEPDATIHDLGAHRQRKTGVTPDIKLTESLVQQWLGNLMADSVLIQKFVGKRGLDEEIMEHFQIGWDRAKRAYTIPIRDIDGKLINVRFYRPDATGKLSKYHNLKGYGRLALFPVDQLFGNDSIVITEGELDALICIQNGINAISVTGGAGNWNRAWTPWFRDKNVKLIYDRDEPGVAGARTVARQLRDVAKTLCIVDLPFPVSKDHGEDVTDFFVKHGMSVDEFNRILEDSDEILGKAKPSEEPPKVVRVLESLSGADVGKTLQMRSTIVGRSTNTHILPEQLSFECSMDAGPKCQICPMLANAGQMNDRIPQDDVFLLKFLDVGDDKKDHFIREHAGIQQCNRMKTDIVSSHVVETLVVRSSIDHAQEDASDHTQRGVVAVGTHDSLPGQTVRFTGTVVPGPKDQVNQFMAWEVDPDKSALDAFEMTAEIGESLKAFQPDSGESVLKHLSVIADDLAKHTTKIYGRKNLHILLDLTYHSAIAFNFNGNLERRGWLDVLVVGDTRTGKSETALRLVEHYGLGSMVSCESASFAGVFGGLVQKFGNEWSVIWGAIPLNDRRIVVLDEVAGLSTDEIARLSAVRSSGIAQLTKVESQAAMARTRLVWMGNPRDGRKMNEFGYEFRAIRPLIGNMEDIARFDLAFSVSSGDVPESKINALYQDAGLPLITQEEYRNLVLWAWSRKVEDIEFDDEATHEVLRCAKGLSEKYLDIIPLIQVANFRIKLARVAVAIAARTFSTDDNFVKLVVGKEHVTAATMFINQIYSREKFGYADESKRQKNDISVANEMSDFIEEFLEHEQLFLSFVRRHIEGLNPLVCKSEMMCTQEKADHCIGTLINAGMIDTTSDNRPNPILLDILRGMP